jgi:hypothetical protein
MYIRVACGCAGVCRLQFHTGGLLQVRTHICPHITCMVLQCTCNCAPGFAAPGWTPSLTLPLVPYLHSMCTIPYMRVRSLPLLYINHAIATSSWWCVAGYFKSIDRWTGRPTDDHKDDDDVEKTTANPLPYTPVPYVSTATAASANATATVERPVSVSVPPQEGNTPVKSSIRCCFCSHGGKWSSYNIHRKLDVTVSLTVLICYFIAIGAVLLPPVAPPTI